MGPRLSPSYWDESMYPTESVASNDPLLGMTESITGLTRHYDDVAIAIEQYNALGRYHDVLTRSLDNGGLSVEALQALTVGMGPATPGLECLDDALTLALEDATVSRGSATTKRRDVVVRKMAKLRDEIVTLLGDLITYLKETWEKLAAAGRAVKTRIGVLQQRLKDLPPSASTPRKQEIKLSGTGRLFADGVYQGNQLGTLTMYGTLVTKTLALEVNQTVADYITFLRALDPNNVSEFDNIYVRTFKDRLLKIKSFVLADSNDKKTIQRMQSPVLPGNLRLYVIQQKEATGLKKFLSYLTSDINVYLQEDQRLKKPPEEYMLKVASRTALARELTTLASIADMVVESGKTTAELQRNLTTLKSLTQTFATKGTTSDKPRYVEDVLKSAQGLQRLPNGVASGVSHLVKTINVCCAVIEKQIVQYTPTTPS